MDATAGYRRARDGRVRNPWRRAQPELPLTDAEHALVERKLELLRLTSFGFTEDRLLHMQHADLAAWTGACAGELRRRIAIEAPPDRATTLLDFPTLRCVSLQCRRVPPAMALALLLSLGAAPIARADVPTTADTVACNAEAPHAVREGTFAPNRADHDRAAVARGTATATSGTGTSVESSDPQIHGMAAAGAEHPTYQAAYRSCMRRKGF